MTSMTGASSPWKTDQRWLDARERYFDDARELDLVDHIAAIYRMNEIEREFRWKEHLDRVDSGGSREYNGPTPSLKGIQA